MENTNINIKIQQGKDGRGYSGFLFLDKNDMPMVALHWEKYIKHIRNKYNSVYKVQMPTITPHVCRHTFCSNMVKAGMNIKALQYIMGHSEVDVTLNTYTHLNYDDVAAEMKKIIDMNSKKNNRQCMSLMKSIYDRIYDNRCHK